MFLYKPFIRRHDCFLVLEDISSTLQRSLMPSSRPAVHEDVWARRSGSRGQVLPGGGSGDQGPQLRLGPEARSPTELRDPELSAGANRYANNGAKTRSRRPLTHGLPLFLCFPAASAPLEDSCRDKPTANCALVLKVKLCSHWYYRKACCQSCKAPRP